jgi:hypothetical protein
LKNKKSACQKHPRQPILHAAIDDLGGEDQSRDVAKRSPGGKPRQKRIVALTICWGVLK